MKARRCPAGSRRSATVAESYSKLLTLSRGDLSGSRNEFSKQYRTRGIIGVVRHLATSRWGGEYVSGFRGEPPQCRNKMPFLVFHGWTGVFCNLDRNALGVKDDEDRWQSPDEAAIPNELRRWHKSRCKTRRAGEERQAVVAQEAWTPAPARGAEGNARWQARRSTWRCSLPGHPSVSSSDLVRHRAASQMWLRFVR